MSSAVPPRRAAAAAPDTAAPVTLPADPLAGPAPGSAVARLDFSIVPRPIRCDGTGAMVPGTSTVANRLQACSQPSRVSGHRSTGASYGAPTTQMP